MSTKICKRVAFLTLLTIAVPISAIIVPVFIGKKQTQEPTSLNEDDDGNELQSSDHNEPEHVQAIIDSKYFISNVLDSPPRNQNGYVMTRINYCLNDGNGMQADMNDLVGNSASSSLHSIRRTTHEAGSSSMQHRDASNGACPNTVTDSIRNANKTIPHVQGENIGADNGEGPSGPSLGWKPVDAAGSSDGLLNPEYEVKNFFPTPTIFTKQDDGEVYFQNQRCGGESSFAGSSKEEQDDKQQ